MNVADAHKKVLKDTEKLFGLVQKEQLKRLKAKTPSDTGRAKASWKIEGDDIVSDVSYIEHLEFGTKNTLPIGMARTTALETESIVKKVSSKIK